MSEPTKPIPFRDLAGPAMRVRETTAQPPTQFFIPRSDAELENILANCDDPNLIAALTKEYLKSKGVLDASHPFGEAGVTVSPRVRPTAGVQRSPANETASLPSARLTEMIEKATDPSQLQIELSLSRAWEPTVEVKQPEPPQPKLYDPNDGCVWKCYPHGNDEILVSGRTSDEAREKAAAVYRKYRMDLPE